MNLLPTSPVKPSLVWLYFKRIFRYLYFDLNTLDSIFKLSVHPPPLVKIFFVPRPKLERKNT